MEVLALILLWCSLGLSGGQVSSGTTDAFYYLQGTSAIFVRSCTYQGSNEEWRWLRDGQKVAGQTGEALSIALPQPTDQQGNYTCQALGPMNQVLGSASTGSLVVLEREDAINFLPVQSVQEGLTSHLVCSSDIPNFKILWTGPNFTTPTTDNLVIENARKADEGEYTCQVILNGRPFLEETIQFLVLLPPRITSSPPDLSLTGNKLINLTVSFISSYSNTTVVTWIKDAVTLPMDMFQIVYDESGERGTTMLTFDPVRRSDSGRYEVQLHNTNTKIQTDKQSARTGVFRLTVQVLPAVPEQLQLETGDNESTTHITWTYPANTSQDGLPEKQELRLSNYSPPVVLLGPDNREWDIQTEPGVMYTAVLVSFNSDGMTESAPRSINIPPSAPKVSKASIFRVSTTAFNISLLVAHTGAGPTASLKLISTEYRGLSEGGGAAWQRLQASILLTRGSGDPNHWHVLVANSEFSDLEEVEFRFSVQNNVISTASVRMVVVGESVLPGPPVIVNGTSTSTTLSLVVQLSQIGTTPLVSLHTFILAIDHPMRMLTMMEGLEVGGAVNVFITDLSPEVSYTVYVYAENGAGRGQDSARRNFTTGAISETFPVWLIAVVAILVSCLVIALVLVILISCYCKRHGNGDKKINLAADVPVAGSNGVRLVPLGAADSGQLNPSTVPLDYTTAMETKSNFILTDPPRGNSPRGHLTNNYQYHSPSRHHSDRLVSNSYQTHDINMDRNDYNNTKSAFLFASSKPRPHASSFSGSDASERSTKFFNYRQSPAHRSFITEDQLSHSMPVLDDSDQDLTPTMPPNCATDV